MALHSTFVHVTHIEDSLRSRQRPYIHFWAIQDFRSYDLMKTYLENIRHYLEASTPPPLNLNLLDRVCCVLINHKWHRARVTQEKLSEAGTIEVICIDSGETHAVPLALVRTLDIPGDEAQCARDWPNQATKFFLGDVVAPKGKKAGSHWSENALNYLKASMLYRTLKAEFLEGSMGDDIEGLRMLDCNNKSLALCMIEGNLGVAAPNDRESSPEIINDVGVESLPDVTANAIPVTESSSLVVISESSHPNSNIVPSMSSKLDKSVPRQVKTIRRAWLPRSSKVKLVVTLAEKPGSFFGQLDKISLKDLDDMTENLMLAYSSEPKPPLLYADCESHLGDYGVVDWGQHERFYRIRVIGEHGNKVKFKFIDWGRCQKITKTRIYAPLESLTGFRKPPFGIHCKIDDVTLSLADWSKLILDKEIRVKIGKFEEEVYSVTLTNDSCNHEISKAISLKTSPTSSSVELTNGTTWIPSGQIESSSGRFTVEILSPDPSYMTNNMPSTSGGQKHEALPDADSRVEKSTDNKFHDEKRKKKYARRYAKVTAIKIAKLVQVRSNTTHEVQELVPNPRKRKSEDGVESTGQGKRQRK